MCCFDKIPVVSLPSRKAATAVGTIRVEMMESYSSWLVYPRRVLRILVSGRKGRKPRLRGNWILTSRGEDSRDSPIVNQGAEFESSVEARCWV
jgi:hypothetical protein